MTQRTVRDTIIFRRPFVLSGFDETLPAGSYTVETFEELVEGLSFPVYRRVETLLHLNPSPGQGNLMQVVVIDPVALEEARQRDADGP